MPIFLEPTSPIGVFDSGIGGLSVLRALRVELPEERLLYVADAAHAPYGERDDVYLRTRALAVTRFLIEQHAIKALVVACNTATAAAVLEMRQTFPDLPIVGIEPALKPAAAVSKTGFIGVMATRGTLNSKKFSSLLLSLKGTATFVLQPCDGLADAIEHDDTSKIEALCSQYTRVMGRFGRNFGEMDVLVLGCTHYPFMAQQLDEIVGKNFLQLEGGAPVARQTRKLLTERQLLNLKSSATDAQLKQLHFLTTGNPNTLMRAASRWLDEAVVAQAITVHSEFLSQKLPC